MRRMGATVMKIYLAVIAPDWQRQHKKFVIRHQSDYNSRGAQLFQEKF